MLRRATTELATRLSQRDLDLPAIQNIVFKSFAHISLGTQRSNLALTSAALRTASLVQVWKKSREPPDRTSTMARALYYRGPLSGSSSQQQRRVNY